MTAVSMNRRTALDGFAMAVMVGLTFSWGLNGVAVKVSNAGFDPALVAFLRSLLSTSLIYVWCVYRRIPLFERDGTLASGLAIGVLFGIEFLLIFFGLDYTSVGRGFLMLNTMPFWVLLGAHFLLGERISPTRLAGMVLAFVGVGVIFSDKLSIPGPKAWLGDIMTLVAGVLWAATTLVIKKSRLATVRPEKVLLYQLATSVVIAGPLLAFTGPLVRDATPLAIGSILFQAFYIVAFTYLVWFWLVTRYPASGLSSFTFLTPAFSVLMGALLLGEPLTWKLGLALLLIATGIVLVNRPARYQGVPNA